MRVNLRPIAAPTLTNLTATAGVRVINLRWTIPEGSTHAKTQIWRATTSNFASATLIDTVLGDSYTLAGVSVVDYYFWVKSVDVYGRATGAASNVAAIRSMLAGELDIADKAVKAAMLDVAAINPNGKVYAEQIAAGQLAAGVAYIGAISASQISAGYLAAGVVYTGTLSASNITSGTFNSADGKHVMTLGASTFVDGLGAAWSIGAKFARTASAGSVGPAIVIDDVSDAPATYAQYIWSKKGSAAKFESGTQLTSVNQVVNINAISANNHGLLFTGSYGGSAVRVAATCLSAAIYAGNSAAASYAIHGASQGVSGRGVMGEGFYGVYGEGNYGVYGYGSTYGVYSQGNAYVAGNLTVTGSISGTVSYAASAGSASSASYASSAGSVSGSNVSGAVSLAAVSSQVSNSTQAIVRCQPSSGSFAGWVFDFCVLNDGNLQVTHNGTLKWSPYIGASDRRLKKQIQATRANGLDTINKLRVVDFRWKKKVPFDDGDRHIGFIAQEVEQVVPHVARQVEGTYVVNKEELVPYLVKAMQELHEEVRTLRAQLNQLTGA